MIDQRVEPLAYTIPEAARQLGCSDTHIRTLVRTGVIPRVKVGGRVVIRRATLESWLAEHEGPANGKHR